MNKKLRTKNTIELLFSISNVVILASIFTFLWAILYKESVIFFLNGYIIIGIIYASILTMFYLLYKGYKIGSTRITELIYSSILAILFTNVLSYLQLSLLVKYLLEIQGFIIILIVQCIFIVIYVVLFSKLFHKIIKPFRILLVYDQDCTLLTEKLAKYQADNFCVAKKIKYDEFVKNKDMCKSFDGVMIYNLKEEERQNIVTYCYYKTISVYNIPNVYDVLLSNSSYMHMIDTPIMMVNNFGPSQISKIIKRLIDLLITLPALIITLPIWLVVMICIKMEDNGPILYKQKRLTQYGKEFYVLKFRSMKVDAEKIGGAQLAKENDDRITKVGKVIRKLRIDELPQLVNIIKGEMSIVGPRPERPELMKKIVEECPEFELRLKVKAGLTGYAQVFGKYNTTSSDKLLMDLMYIENYSLLMDIKLMFMTVKILFMKESTEGIQ